MSDITQDAEKYLPDIDVNDGVKRVMNKTSIYTMLVGKFKPHVMADDIINKIQSGADANEIRNAAHSLKGSAANLSMPVISRAAQLIEEAAKRGENGAEYITRLKDAADALDEKIKMMLG